MVGGVKGGSIEESKAREADTQKGGASQFQRHHRRTEGGGAPHILSAA